ncbi:MAG: tetratricopeptide repeat protein [Pseudomonadota bacterium]
MRLRFAAITCAAVLAFALPAAAGQKDKRLDGLFARLQSTGDMVEAQVIEQTIWQIWTAAGDAPTDTLMGLGLDAMQAGDLAGALLLFDAITAQQPDFAEGWNKRATVLYMLGAMEASAADVGRTLALEPRHFGALAGLGLINTALKREAEALTAFESALKLNPHMPGVKANVEMLRKRQRGAPI